MHDSKPYTVFVLFLSTKQKGICFTSLRTDNMFRLEMPLNALNIYSFILSWEFEQNVDTLSVGTFEQRQHAV